MKAEVEEAIKKINRSLSLIKERIDYEQSKVRLAEVNNLLENNDIWDKRHNNLSMLGNPQDLLKERTDLERKINIYEELKKGLEENEELYELALEEQEEQICTELEGNILDLQKESSIKELESLFSDVDSGSDCYLELHSGAGGVEACDWAMMLLRMYMRWANNKGYKVETLEYQEGEEVGIKSATILIKGLYAYGWLRFEAGVHRLVRISPFDSNARRHTSFAAVDVYPARDNIVEIEINDKDLRIDTFRASGAGGQHVNTTDSAVRITHLPTNVVVQCHNERSQHRNKDTALKMLKAKLYELKVQEHKTEQQIKQELKDDNGWGYKIRSYVMQPYRLVKDLRTSAETSDVDDILNGKIDKFLQASLAQLNIKNTKE